MPDSNQTLPLPTPPSDEPKPDDKPVSPVNDAPTEPKLNPDAALQHIRDKVSQLYNTEPSAVGEEQEIIATGSHSNHQEFIENLMNSGESAANIQKAWHGYYASLPDDQKHAVWNEFNRQQGAQQAKLNTQPNQVAELQPSPEEQTTVKRELPETPQDTPQKKQPKPKAQSHSVTATGTFISGFIRPKENTPQGSDSSFNDSKNELIDKVSARGKLKPKHHLQSLFFGLSMGVIVLALFMFSFFNERFIAPFVTPSRTASSTPIIMDPNAKVGPESLIIIPKINVEVPVVYDAASTAEKDIQAELENGVVHYPTTPVPGQDGNVVIVGHSSNNLFNSGKYKFAFVLLNKLQEGDTITMQYEGKRYVYKVYQKEIVKPTDTSVLGPADKKATLTLITCDPPGTSINRLIVVAEQISPDPNSNTAAAEGTQTASTESQPATVPGNAPSLFQSLFSWL